MPTLFEIKREHPVDLQMHACLLGDDLSVVICGGDAEHIGAATLSVPRESLRTPGRRSSNTSVLSVTGHKEDVLFREVGASLAEHLGGTVVVSGGIHVNDASDATIDALAAAVRNMAAELKMLLEAQGRPCGSS